MSVFNKFLKIDGPEQGAQIYFHDDDSFSFRMLPIEDSLLKKKDRDENTEACWAMFFSLRKRFEGYKNSPPCPVTLSYSRDFILDIFNQLDPENKPKDKSKKTAFLKDLTERREYELFAKIKPRPIFDKFMIFLCSVIAVLGIFLAVKFIT